MYSKTAVKVNRVDKLYRVSLIYLCKIHDSVICVEYWYFIGVSSHSYIGHCVPEGFIFKKFILKNVNR